MGLTILSIAFPFAPVGSEAVGGAEQILSSLDEALVAAGHTSMVAACEGSQVAGELLALRTTGDGALGETERARARKEFQAVIDHVLASRRVDVVHMHGLDFGDYLLPADIPVLVTLHLPLAWYPGEVWEKWRGRARFCCVSKMQREQCAAELGAVLVENGVDLPPRIEGNPKRDFAVVMGRICPEKNAHAALEAGTLAGVPVVVCGEVFPYREHREYFETKIRPLVNGGREGGEGAMQHRFAGPVSGAAKYKLLARAKCLLHPTLAPETSSLVAMEAMAAGTPVIAYRSGALAEIVEDGVTGFLVDGVKEMAEAINNVDGICAERCRETAAKRFDRRRMVQEYFALYESLAGRGQETAMYA